MSVHRWRLRRIIGWLVPVLAYLCVLSIMASSYRASGEGRAFVSDDAYRNLVMANVLKDAGVYGVSPDQPVPMVQDMLWRVGLAGAQFMVPDGLTAVRILGMLFGVLALLQLIRLCQVVFPYPLFGYYTAGLVVLAPGLAAAALSGLAVPLAMYLVTAALVRHLENISGSGSGIPLASVCFIGLAMWVRLEFIVVWLLLLTHSLVWGAIPGERRPSLLTVVLRGVNGILILALFLLPVLAWNMHVLQVPWPRLPGVPLTANLWAIEGAGAAWSATVHVMGEGWESAGVRFREHAFPGMALGRVFFWIGCLLLVIQAVRSREERPFALFLLMTPIMVPFLFGLAYPYVGWTSLPIIAASFLPVMVAITAYGVVRLPFVVESVAGPWLPPRLTTDRSFAVWWGAAGGLLILLSVSAQVRETRAETQSLRAQLEERAWLASLIDKEALTRDRFISDRPGWLVWRHGLAMLDLRAEWSPDLLPFVSLEGDYDVDPLGAYVERLNPPPGVLVVWNPDFQPLAGILPHAEIMQEPDEERPDRALVVMGTWPGVL